MVAPWTPKDWETLAWALVGDPLEAECAILQFITKSGKIDSVPCAICQKWIMEITRFVMKLEAISDRTFKIWQVKMSVFNVLFDKICCMWNSLYGHPPSHHKYLRMMLLHYSIGWKIFFHHCFKWFKLQFSGWSYCITVLVDKFYFTIVLSDLKAHKNFFKQNLYNGM